jgi:dihydrodipicolinate synthase/N-acetylneuraminate lyase
MARREAIVSVTTWTWRDALRGVIPPMISPLTPTFEVDTLAVGRVVDHILEGGCTGLFVLGGVGEGAWLNSAQRYAIVRSTVASAAGRAPVLVGVMLPATAPTRDEALRAADAGADALVVGSPYYFEPDAASQQRHIEAILRATSLPVLLYNIPQCTHTPLAEETVSNLANEPGVLGVKDSWGDLPYFQSLLTLKQKRADFRVLQGNEYAAMASLLLGADGLIPGLANVAPRLLVDLVSAARGGDTAECQRIHDVIFDLTRIYARGAGLAGLYAAAARLGLCQNVPAEPWLAVDENGVETIVSILRAHDVLPVESVV